MFFWLHLKFDDIQKWYIDGYLEIRWMSYFIGLYLMYRFFLFITSMGHWLYATEGSKNAVCLALFSHFFQPTNTLEEYATLPLKEVVSFGPSSSVLQYKEVFLCQIWIPYFPPLNVMYTIFFAILILLILCPTPPHLFYAHILNTVLALYFFYLIYTSLQPAYYR